MSDDVPTWYRRRLQAGLCRCGNPLAPARARCAECLLKMSQDAKLRYKRYANEGRCRRCKSPLTEGRIYCPEHLEKAKQESKKAVASFIRRRLDAGLCVTCGQTSSTYNCEGCRRRFRRKRT